MPRLKQQRPRHIVEDDSDEEQIPNVATPSSDQNEVASAAMDDSPQATICTPDLQTLQGDWRSPRPGSSYSAASVENVELCENTKRDEAADDRFHSRSTLNENDYCLDRADGARSPSKARNDATRKGGIAPFITLQQRSTENVTRESPKTDQNTNARPDSNGYFNDIISRSIRSARDMGRENGERALPHTSGALKNGDVSSIVDPRWSAMLQNSMLCPLQLMAKLFYESRMDNMLEAEEALREVTKAEKRIPGSSSARMTSTLNAIRNQILDKRNDFSGDEGRHSGCERPPTAGSDSPARTRESSGGRSSSSPKRVPANVTGNMFRPFLPSEEPISREKNSPNSTNRDHSNPKHLDLANIYAVKNGAGRFLPLPWHGMSPFLMPHSGQQIVHPTSSPRNERDAKARSLSPNDHMKHAKSDEIDSSPSPTHLGLPVKASSSVQPLGRLPVSPKPSTNRYKSPSPLWATHRQATMGVPYQRYVNSSQQRSPNPRSPDKFMAPYGYPPMLGGPHTPSFTLPNAPLSEFPAVPASPYYSPWAMMYPPIHLGIEAMSANPLFHSLQAETRAMRNGGVPKSPTGVPPSRPSSNPSYSNARKPTLARSKAQPTSPIDMYHAAIVREAKEANKGMDPENMYIECPICHKKIKRLYHFQRHMRIHSGEKSHACPYCPYKSVRKDNLKSHLKTHEKSKYDAPRRMPQKRENPSKAAFPPASEFRVSPYPGKGDLSRPLAGAPPPFLPFKGRHPSESPPNSLRRPSSEKSPLDFLAPKLSSHPTLRDMALLSPAGYRHEGKLGFPYNGFPPISPFLGFPPRDGRGSRVSPPCITEIDDKVQALRASSLCPESSLPGEYQNGTISPLKRQKTPETYADSPPPAKLSKEDSLETEESLLLRNLNNSNNLDAKSPIRAVLPSKNDSRNDSAEPALKVFVKEPNPQFLQEMEACETEDSVSASKSISEEAIAPKNGIHAPFEENYKLFVGQNGELQHRLQHLATTLGLDKFLACKAESDENRNDNDQSPRHIDSKSHQRQKSQKSMDDFKNHVVVDRSPLSGVEQQRFETSENVVWEEAKSKPRSELASPENLAPKIESRESMMSSSEETLRNSSGGADTSWLGQVNRESKCRLCEFAAPSNASLQEHMTTHKEFGLYKCQQCDYHGKNLSKLIEHIRIHTGERPFQCDQCSYAAKRKDNLAQHKSVRHVKNRAKGPPRVIKLSPDVPVMSGNEREEAPFRRNSQYASIVVASSSPSSVKDVEVGRPFWGNEWFAKLGDGVLPIPFSGDKSADGAIQRRASALSAGDYSSNSAFRPRVYPFQPFLSYSNMTS